MFSSSGHKDDKEAFHYHSLLTSSSGACTMIMILRLHMDRQGFTQSLVGAVLKGKESLQRVELAASEGRSCKNQFRMFTEPMDTCLFYVSCIIKRYILFKMFQKIYIFSLFRKNKERNDSQRFYRNGSSALNIRGKVFAGFNYVTVSINQYGRKIVYEV